MTVFTVTKNIDENTINLVHKWQNIAHKLHRDRFFRRILKFSKDKEGDNTVHAVFKALYLGRTEVLLKLMGSNFPKLDLKDDDCREMSWVESVIYFHNGYSKNEPLNLLRDRNYNARSFFKSKSDFVTQPISPSHLEDKRLKFMDRNRGIMIWDPQGEK